MLGLRVERLPLLEQPGVMTDVAARRIASEWHAGASSPSYQFASTGRITEALEGELVAVFRSALRLPGFDWRALAELNELILYVRTYGPREAVENWSELTW